MSNVRTIRKRLGMTQAELAVVLGCTQGNVGHYEQGQTVPPAIARRLIRFALQRGEQVSYEDVYGPVSAADDDGSTDEGGM